MFYSERKSRFLASFGLGPVNIAASSNQRRQSKRLQLMSRKDTPQPCVGHSEWNDGCTGSTELDSDDSAEPDSSKVPDSVCEMSSGKVKHEIMSPNSVASEKCPPLIQLHQLVNAMKQESVTSVKKDLPLQSYPTSEATSDVCKVLLSHSEDSEKAFCIDEKRDALEDKSKCNKKELEEINSQNTLDDQKDYDDMDDLCLKPLMIDLGSPAGEKKQERFHCPDRRDERAASGSIAQNERQTSCPSKSNGSGYLNVTMTDSTIVGVQVAAATEAPDALKDKGKPKYTFKPVKGLYTQSNLPGQPCTITLSRTNGPIFVTSYGRTAVVGLKQGFNISQLPPSIPHSDPAGPGFQIPLIDSHGKKLGNLGKSTYTTASSSQAPSKTYALNFRPIAIKAIQPPRTSDNQKLELQKQVATTSLPNFFTQQPNTDVYLPKHKEESIQDIAPSSMELSTTRKYRINEGKLVPNNIDETDQGSDAATEPINYSKQLSTKQNDEARNVAAHQKEGEASYSALSNNLNIKPYNSDPFFNKRYFRESKKKFHIKEMLHRLGSEVVQEAVESLESLNLDTKQTPLSASLGSSEHDVPMVPTTVQALTGDDTKSVQETFPNVGSRPLMDYTQPSPQMLQQRWAESVDQSSPDKQSDADLSLMSPDRECLNPEYDEVIKLITATLSPDVTDTPMDLSLCKSPPQKKSRKGQTRKAKMIHTCECGHSTQSKAALEKHADASGCRPFVCRMCSKTFKRDNYLKQHISVVHLNKDKYLCRVCKKSCSTKQWLNRHLRSHSEDQALQTNEEAIS